MAFLQGFSDGYQTMDTIAALNFGLVIATTLHSFGLKEKQNVIKHTVLAGIFAGMILSCIYMMLTYVGMCSSGVYPIQENGAWTLRCIVSQLFGQPGAILLAAIFTLACLTTCVGLINSISQYFSTLFNKINYRTWVFIIVIFSFFICNLGLNAILSISIPILNAIYPVSIVLIILGLSHKFWQNNPYVYPVTITLTSIISVIYAMDSAGFSLGMLSSIIQTLPLYSSGFGWVLFTILGLIMSILLKQFKSTN
jgi:LIVCS family branched-chain amino acid:cation transporter